MCDGSFRLIQMMNLPIAVSSPVLLLLSVVLEVCNVAMHPVIMLMEG